jgi:glycosyltransferase involved in cell wall biosynthesis
MSEPLSLSSDELPLVPTEKSGWPWKHKNPPITSDSISWPKITVFTPNYNYGHYLEETIRSVLLQGYPNLEYIIIDGGSNDNSVEVIKKYEPWLAYWNSEKDRGQTDAINKGLAKATGEIFNWINSDDILMPGALFAIAQGMQNSDAFVGVVNNFYENDREVKVVPQNITSKGLLTGFDTTDFPSKQATVYHQPGFWFKTKYLQEIGFLNEELNLQFDFDRVVRYVHHHPNVNYSDRVLVNFRCHQEQKTAPANVKQEGKCIANSILADVEYRDLHQPAKLWLDRLIWYEDLTTITQQQGSSRIVKALKLLLRSCANPHAYWTRYTFGGIRKLLIE